MAKNKKEIDELVKKIEALAEELNIPAVTDGFTEAQLKEVLEDLEKQKSEADEAAAKAAEDGEVAAKAAEDGEVAEVKKPPYYVADGQAVTCIKGIVVGEGEEMKAEFLGGGEESLKALVKKKIVLKG